MTDLWTAGGQLAGRLASFCESLPVGSRTTSSAVRFPDPPGWLGSFCEKFCNYFHKSSLAVQERSYPWMRGELL